MESEQAPVLAAVASVVLLLVVLELVRRHRLVEEYSIVWVVCAVGLLGVSLWRGGLGYAASFLGIAYPPSLLLFGAVVLAIGGLLALSVVLSGQQRRIEDLTEETAVLAAEIRDLRAGGRSRTDAAPKVVPYTRPHRRQASGE